VKISDVISQELVFRFLKIFVVVLVIYLVLRGIGMQQVFASDPEGVGALLQVVGTLYSVLYAFATYVIWGQFTAVESEIVKESGALQDLILFSNRLKPQMREPILHAVRAYARAVSETEWSELAGNEPTSKTDRLFSEIVAAVGSVRPEDEMERLVHERLFEIANQASAHRAERLSLSVKRIPRTLLILVSLTALMIVLLVFIYPFRNTGLGAGSLAITTMLLSLAHFVITDLDNPFTGTWNVTPQCFEELAVKAR
jgi:small-conductance mechanosensitive channel